MEQEFQIVFQSLRRDSSSGRFEIFNTSTLLNSRFNLSGEIPQVAAGDWFWPRWALLLFQSLRRDSSSGRAKIHSPLLVLLRRFNLSGEIPQVAASVLSLRAKPLLCFNLSGEIPQVAAREEILKEFGGKKLFQSLRRDSSSGREDWLKRAKRHSASFNLSGEIPQVAAALKYEVTTPTDRFNLSGEIPQVAAPRSFCSSSEL